MCRIVDGMIELGDSVQQDFANQRFALSDFQCRTFAEVHESSLDLELKIENISRLPGVLGSPLAPVIHHWYEVWHDVDGLLAGSRARLIVRWHNDAAPWVFAPYSPRATSRMLRGYESILKLADAPGIWGLADSSFKVRQPEPPDGAVTSPYKSQTRTSRPDARWHRVEVRSVVSRRSPRRAGT